MKDKVLTKDKFAEKYRPEIAFEEDVEIIEDKFLSDLNEVIEAEIKKRNAVKSSLPPAEGAEEILIKGKILMHGKVMVDNVMLAYGIYGTVNPFLYLSDATIENRIAQGRGLQDKMGKSFLPESYFENLAKCEFRDVVVVTAAALHAQRLADKMVEERMPKEEEIQEQADLHYERGGYNDIWRSGALWFRSRMEGKSK